MLDERACYLRQSISQNNCEKIHILLVSSA